ncbi:MAG: HEAT repeat domain-containing protein [Candidatus Omnitrophica bacterium]|nr:HEAT repeat domain-containing protein [Candidatus Omnitrophota bacterium]
MQTKSTTGVQNDLAHFLGVAVKSVEKEFSYLLAFGRRTPAVVKAVAQTVAVTPAPAAVVAPAVLPVSRIEPVVSLPVVEKKKPEPALEKALPVRQAGLKNVAFANKTEEVEVEIYFRDIQSPSRAVRIQALRQIKKLSRPTAVAMLEELLSREQDTLQIIELLNALASVSEDGATTKEVFKNFIGHQDTGIRLAALRAISKYHDDEGFNILASALKDRDHEVRRQVLNCLCWSFSERCSLHAVAALHDPDPGVRKAAAQITGALKVAQAISGLITLLADTDHDVQSTAAVSLKKITGEDFGFKARSSKTDKDDAIEAWRFWWRENQTKFKLQLNRG